EDGIRDPLVTGVQTCALPIWRNSGPRATSFAFQLCPVGHFSSAFSWIVRPLSVAFTTFALAVFFPSESNRGARKIAVSVCHSPRSEERRVGKGRGIASRAAAR